MAYSHSRAASSMGYRSGGGSYAKKTYFEQQREILIGDIALSFEQVLANINKLNRSLEAVITVGNEFSSVEALWSQFEGVMAREEEAEALPEGDGQAETEVEGEDDGESESHVREHQHNPHSDDDGNTNDEHRYHKEAGDAAAKHDYASNKYADEER